MNHIKHLIRWLMFGPSVPAAITPGVLAMVSPLFDEHWIIRALLLCGCSVLVFLNATRNEILIEDLRLDAECANTEAMSAKEAAKYWRKAFETHVASGHKLTSKELAVIIATAAKSSLILFTEQADLDTVALAIGNNAAQVIAMYDEGVR